MDPQQNDFDLLQAFVRNADQPAFAAVVKRHIDLVYATAFRTMQDQGGAEEVAQLVFGVLAKKAWLFAADDSLPPWCSQELPIKKPTRNTSAPPRPT